MSRMTKSTLTPTKKAAACAAGRGNARAGKGSSFLIRGMQLLGDKTHPICHYNSLFVSASAFEMLTLLLFHHWYGRLVKSQAALIISVMTRDLSGSLVVKTWHFLCKGQESEP